VRVAEYLPSSPLTSRIRRTYPALAPHRESKSAGFLFNGNGKRLNGTKNHVFNYIGLSGKKVSTPPMVFMGFKISLGG